MVKQRVVGKKASRRARSKRARKAKAKVQTAMSLPARTTAAVEKDLRTMPKPFRGGGKMKAFLDKAYLNCRFDPWRYTSGNGIPDGTSRRAVVGDSRSFADISIPVGGTMFILIVPGLPTAAYCKQGTNIPVTISTPTSNFTLNQGAGPSTDLTTNWIPLVTYPEVVSTANPFVLPNVPGANRYGASKARIVTQAYDLMYTGQAFNANGIVTVRPIRFDKTGAPIFTTAVSNISQSDGSAGSFPAGCKAQWYNLATSNFVYSKETAIMRPEAGLCGLLRHEGVEHEWQGWSDDPFLIATTEGGNVDESGTSVTVFSSNVAGSTNGGNYWVDDGWEAAMISITNVTAAVSFRLETLTCYEMELNVSSAFAPFVKKPPQPSPQSLQLAAAVGGSADMVKPAGQQSSWLTDVSKAAGSTFVSAGLSAAMSALGI
jgi:hypothetical protein